MLSLMWSEPLRCTSTYAYGVYKRSMFFERKLLGVCGVEKKKKRRNLDLVAETRDSVVNGRVNTTLFFRWTRGRGRPESMVNASIAAWRMLPPQYVCTEKNVQEESVHVSEEKKAWDAKP